MFPFIYRAYLSRFYIFRFSKEAALLVYRFFYKIFCTLHCRVFSENNYFLISINNFKELKRSKFDLFEHSTVNVVACPKIITNLSKIENNNNCFEIDSPKIEVIEICKGTAIGGTNFILSDNYAIYPDLFDPTTDSSPAKVYGVASIKRNNTQVRFYLYREQRYKLKSAISLLGQSTSNYAHWVTETLPKLLVLNCYPEYKDMPVMIDYRTNPIFLESIKLLDAHKHKLLNIRQCEPVSAERLIDISPTGYEPYIPQGIRYKENKNINKFSSTALNMVRTTAVQKIKSNKKRLNKYLFLRRNNKSGNVRRVKNIHKIEELLLSYGFSFADTSAMNFKGQIEVCHSANIIMAPVGAALVNMIFAPKGCKIFALAPYFKNSNYYFYSNLASAMGHEMFFILGEPDNNGGHPTHRDYTIDLGLLNKVLNEFIGTGWSN